MAKNNVGRVTQVLGAVAGVMGSLAALESIRAIFPFGSDPAGQLLLVDGAAFRFRTIALPKDPTCPGCLSHQASP